MKPSPWHLSLASYLFLLSSFLLRRRPPPPRPGILPRHYSSQKRTKIWQMRKEKYLFIFYFFVLIRKTECFFMWKIIRVGVRNVSPLSGCQTGRKFQGVRERTCCVAPRWIRHNSKQFLGCRYLRREKAWQLPPLSLTNSPLTLLVNWIFWKQLAWHIFVSCCSKKQRKWTKSVFWPRFSPYEREAPDPICTCK